MSHPTTLKRRPPLVAALAVLTLALGSVMVMPSAALASDTSSTTIQSGGSDDPTPYTLTSKGVQLPEGDVFKENGHINIRLTTGQQLGIHFESLNRPADDPKAFYIGKSFFPWSAYLDDQGKSILKAGDCVEWAQLETKDGYNQHYGEGNKPGKPVTQPPVCITPEEPEEPEEPPTAPDPKYKSEPVENEPVCLPEGGGTVTTVMTNYISTPTWDEKKKEYVYGEWVKTGETTTSRPATEQECPTPTTPEKPEDKVKTKVITDEPVCVPEGGSGTATSTTKTYTSTPVWDKDKQDWVYGEWVETDSKTTTRPATAEECPVVIPPAPEPKEKTVEHESEPVCVPEGGAGTVTTTTETYTSTPVWNAEKKEYVYGEWVLTAGASSIRPATEEECPVIIPPAPEPKVKTTVTEGTPVCVPAGGEGTFSSTTTFFKSTPVWDADKKNYVDGEWVKTDSKTTTRAATAKECPVTTVTTSNNPPKNVVEHDTLAQTGMDSSMLAWVWAGGGTLLLLGALAVSIEAVRRRRQQAQ